MIVRGHAIADKMIQMLNPIRAVQMEYREWEKNAGQLHKNVMSDLSRCNYSKKLNITAQMPALVAWANDTFADDIFIRDNDTDMYKANIPYPLFDELQDKFTHINDAMKENVGWSSFKASRNAPHAN